MLEPIFYRVYIYYERNNDSTPIFQACIVLTIVAFLNVFDIYLFFEHFFKIQSETIKL